MDGGHTQEKAVIAKKGKLVGKIPHGCSQPETIDLFGANYNPFVESGP
jgi:hypothetical protein